MLPFLPNGNWKKRHVRFPRGKFWKMELDFWILWIVFYYCGFCSNSRQIFHQGIFITIFFLGKRFYVNFRFQEHIQWWSVFGRRIELTDEYIFSGNLKYFWKPPPKGTSKNIRIFRNFNKNQLGWSKFWISRNTVEEIRHL